ncbi:ATP-grasp domain-containing protein [Thiospirillum jenense]|uniref:protein-tyrosine-phosphatase n=1 Tax=Thiospirillum jenense TaxID=1653858 RepID=A0A839HAW7_9GAMM|nr:ATP-grasp domain-containing protein [Thiospirillum jenense]MBB1125901.1 ATP-grasp domain-containing protein [Thiospirillum jenense]
MQNIGQYETVLVLDGDMVPSLTIARSLTQLKVDVVIASHLPKPLANYSRTVKQCLLYPDPLSRTDDFIAWCRTQIALNVYRLIIPVTERTLVPLMTLSNAADRERIAMAPPTALAVALFKSRTLELAERLQIPIPKSQLITTEHAVITAANLGLKLPVVIKPGCSIGEHAFTKKQLQVSYAFDVETVNVKLQQYLPYGPVLLQEYMIGQGIGIELIANHGEIRYAFQHLRLHEVPLTGGGSSLRMSVAIEPCLLATAQKLMKALHWHGVAMVEFKWDPQTQTFALMEINGRFWGSLPLAVAAGADFPAMLYELLTTGIITTTRPAKIGVMCRKLDRDLYWYEQVLRHDAPSELVHFPSRWQLLRDSLLVFSPRHYFDVQSWRDPLPGIIDIGRIISDYYYRALQLWHHRYWLFQQRRAWRSGQIKALLQNAKQVLFVCYGNINRSAFAERYVATVAPKTHLIIRSAGFHHETGRAADPMMINVARQVGVDMTSWSSVCINSDLVTASDVIFVMEYCHYKQLIAALPRAKYKTFLLGMAGIKDSLQGAVEIADPFGQQRCQYENCVQSLVLNVNYVLDSIKTTQLHRDKQ